MIINYWDTKDYLFDTEVQQVLDECESKIIGPMLKDLKGEAVHLNTIEIETINRCNNDCTFCPANKNTDIRKPILMKEDLFKKIIDELASINYSGRVNLFSNDEPLLDKRIVSFIKYAREKLPNAYHSLFTNGILLTKEIYCELVDNLDYLRINNYNDNLEINTTIKSICDSNIDNKNCFVVCEVRKKTQILLNRGGLSPNNKKKYMYKSPCLLPFIQMVIRPDGKVSRCCQDVYGNTTLGDINKQSVMEVWNGKEYTYYREEMLSGNRNIMKHCQDCDIYGRFSEYPDRWEYEYFKKFINVVIESKNNKVAMFNINQYKTISDVLIMNNIVSEYNSSFDDIDYYIDNKYFLIFNNVDKLLVEKLKKRKYEPGINYIVYTGMVKGNNNRLYLENKKSKVSELAKESFVMFGAGVTARKIIEEYGLIPERIVDNYHMGDTLLGKIVESPEVLKDMKDKSIIIAANDYMDIVKELNTFGIPSKNIIYGKYLI